MAFFKQTLTSIHYLQFNQITSLYMPLYPFIHIYTREILIFKSLVDQIISLYMRFNPFCYYHLPTLPHQQRPHLLAFPRWRNYWMNCWKTQPGRRHVLCACCRNCKRRGLIIEASYQIPGRSKHTDGDWASVAASDRSVMVGVNFSLVPLAAEVDHLVPRCTKTNELQQMC